MKTQFLIIAIFLLSFSVLMAQENEEKLNTKTQKIAASQVQQSVDNSVVANAPSSTGGSNSIATVTTYDFTTGSDKYEGGSIGAKFLGYKADGITEVWGMVAGDANASGTVSNADKDPINTELNLSGYYNSDINMSGTVSNADKDKINSNLNKSTQAP